MAGCRRVLASRNRMTPRRSPLTRNRLGKNLTRPTRLRLRPKIRFLWMRILLKDQLRAFAGEAGAGSLSENALKSRAPFRFNQTGKRSGDQLFFLAVISSLEKLLKSPSLAACRRQDLAIAGYLISTQIFATCCCSFSLPHEGQAGTSDDLTNCSKS